jgi:hypothetical protein
MTLTKRAMPILPRAIEDENCAHARAGVLVGSCRRARVRRTPGRVISNLGGAGS